MSSIDPGELVSDRLGSGKDRRPPVDKCLASQVGNRALEHREIEPTDPVPTAPIQAAAFTRILFDSRTLSR